MKFQATWDVENDDEGAGITEEEFVEEIEESTERLLMDEGFSNVEVKLVD